MNDKCFCHLNGFAVKDATARNEIETIKTNYATKEYVDGNTFNEEVLEPYATTEYVNAAVAKIDLEPYATTQYVDSKVPTYTTLFNNMEGVTDSTINLSDNITNYDYIEVYYGHGLYNHYVKAVAINDTIICLESANINANSKAIYQSTVQMKLSGNQITKVSGGYCETTNSNHSYLESASMTIRRVVGIKL